MTEMEEFTLDEMFQADTKKTIINTARLLGIRINQGQRKAEIAKTMAVAILAFPEELLQQLPFSEVLILQQMVHAKGPAVPSNPSFITDCIEQIGLTDTRGVGKKAVDYIYPDLAGALLPAIDTFVEKILNIALVIMHFFKLLLVLLCVLYLCDKYFIKNETTLSEI